MKISLLYNHDAIVNVKWSDDSTEVKNVAWHIIVSALNPNCFSLKEETVFYNGQPHTDMVLYTPSGGVHYTEGTDYRIDYTADTINKGDKTATIVGINGYAGSTPIVLEFEVLPLPITVTFEEHQAFLYDRTEHTPTFEHSEIMEGDTVTFSLDVKQMVNAGPYTSIVSISGDVSNYEYTPVSISWSVEKRIVYVIAESDWKPHDGTALTCNKYKAVGILEADKEMFHITVIGSQTEVGTSANVIDCVVDAEVKNNYIVNKLDGSLIVTTRANDISYMEVEVEVQM